MHTITSSRLATTTINYMHKPHTQFITRPLQGAPQLAAPLLQTAPLLQAMTNPPSAAMGRSNRLVHVTKTAARPAIYLIHAIYPT